ncbi:hypothetical protein [Sphingopyxis macrogoltabida]|uniref:Iron transporter n=1 Tax=Sphingopyxis macrogoltabida TaxID=33050 RepID=A0A0N9V3F0_SPHMC|nr:hypothetical protein [Sphingopyxis macrogoltabida]ALH82822.1 hypothetical protein AN936_21395 [Sphingopyxis macrogoltabida]
MAKAAEKLRGANRRDVMLRILAAVPLNYALTALLTVWLARILPGGPAQASVGATLMSFAIFALIAMLCFAVRSTAKLWLVMVGAGAALALADWLLILWGGRL